MSIESTISRFMVARDAQAVALVAKGVAVPDGAGFEDFPALTEAIAAGGNHELEDGLVTRTLTEYTNDRVTEIGAGVFNSNLTIQKVSFPNVVRLDGTGQFTGCKALVEIDFPKLEKASNANSFYQCQSLREAIFPNFSYGGINLQNCYALEYLDFGRDVEEGRTIYFQNLFSVSNCSLLTTIVLRYNKLAPLSSTGAVSGTPFAVGGTGGTVYVPQAMIEQYQTATNWSVLYEAGTCVFMPIEGSEYE